MKKTVRLSEKDLHRVIKESVKRILREWENEEDDLSWKIDDVCEQFGDGPVVINGVLGLWDGQHKIQPVDMNDIRSAIYKCIGRDGELMSEEDIEFDGNAVTMSVHHHDGTNNFTITPA